ncbi:hypothetical protein EDB81DRAFT_922413 [Dactylonectria macrodidyma]|uniref:Uncharacterized protein n=1 Tax=Dactylonectria macrodidyma TaxID=307937 RepID=A0A9P9D3W9_9HYPO|nr:hypothetical protein EDB81DRAFT_922413 [Dactylonectria macrodidyma]
MSGREIFVTERMDLDLVWPTGRCSQALLTLSTLASFWTRYCPWWRAAARLAAADAQIKVQEILDKIAAVPEGQTSVGTRVVVTAQLTGCSDDESCGRLISQQSGRRAHTSEAHPAPPGRDWPGCWGTTRTFVIPLLLRKLSPNFPIRAPTLHRAAFRFSSHMLASNNPDDSDDSVVYLGCKRRGSPAPARLTTATAAQIDAPPETKTASNLDNSGSRYHQQPKTRVRPGGKMTYPRAIRHGPTAATGDRTKYPNRRANTTSPGRVSDRNGHGHRGPRTRPGRRLSSEATVPFEIRNKYFKVGWVMNWNKSTPPPAVYGIFDKAGRLHLFRGHEGAESSMERPTSAPIDHGNVKYDSPFKDMSHTEVRKMAIQRLIRRCGPHLGPGEI